MGHIVAHDVSWAAQTGKHLLRTQNVSEQNQKHFLCSGHKICIRNKCCARGQTGKHLCRNNVSSFARALSLWWFSLTRLPTEAARKLFLYDFLKETALAFAFWLLEPVQCFGKTFLYRIFCPVT